MRVSWPVVFEAGCCCASRNSSCCASRNSTDICLSAGLKISSFLISPFFMNASLASS